MAATTTPQKKYMVRLEAATADGPNISSASLAAMTVAAIRAEHKAVEALLEAMKRRLGALKGEIKRRK
jgi:thioredoxin-like negative regulator of GroEL